MINKANVTTLIFDFDGTIADTLELHRDIYNQLAQKYQRKLISESDISNLRDYGMRDFLKRMNIPLYRLPFLIQEGQTLAKSHPISDTIPGMSAVLNQLAPKYRLGILTSNTKQYCQQFLTHHHLDQNFSFLQAERDLFGKDHKLRKLLKDERLTPQEVIYIGDEARDMEAAKKVGISPIGVSWGFNSQQTLRNAGAKELFKQPEELLSFLTK